MVSAPEATDSIMSLPEPSWPAGKDWMSTRPEVFSFTCLAMRSTICTCGCVAGSISPQRSTIACALAIAGMNTAAPAAVEPWRKLRFVSFVIVVSLPCGRFSGSSS